MKNHSNDTPVTYIGVDFGERRVGLARINTYARLSEPLRVVDTGKESIEAVLESLIQEHSADGIVVGLPRGLDGQETAQTEFSRIFAKKVSEAFSIPVYLIDEAGTSKGADERMKAKGLSEGRDAVAAAILLEDFVAFEDKASLQVDA